MRKEGARCTRRRPARRNLLTHENIGLPSVPVFGEDIENLPETFLADVFECVLDNGNCDAGGS
jgi:hypothetical protein